jgi:hypothetical protein
VLHGVAMPNVNAERMGCGLVAPSGSLTTARQGGLTIVQD